MLTSESPQAKLARKQEAKNLKRQRIIDGGGKRPRKEVDNNDKNNNQRNTKKKKQQNNKSSFSSSSNGNVKNRFGRVMINTPCPNKPRTSTLSIAIPGSIVSNAQTTELRTYLIGQIARACTVYHVDEIIVFDDNLSQQLKVRSGYQRGGYHNRNRDYNNRDNRDYNRDSNKGEDKNQKSEGGIGNNEDKKEGDDQKEVLRPSTDPHTFMANILQYCECPQYLRRHFFPMHPDLQFAGLLNPLDAPHHVRLLDRCLFREGVVTDKKGKGGENNTDDKGGSLVDCGIRGKLVEIDRILPPGIRCTVQMELKGYGAPGKKNMKGKAVGPSAPREHDGTYWGYSVRMASSIKSIFDEAPYKNGYDLKIGTSERGNISVDEEDFLKKISDKVALPTSSATPFQHAVIVFGGVAGIEECVDADETIGISGNDSQSLFDLWVNICEYQGSRTIRTEEAVLIGLSRLCPHLFPINQIDINGKAKKSPTASSRSTSTTVDFSDDEPSEEDSNSDESD